ncbi:hypothetical protein [Deinococcus sp. KNUC1210]|uniref:hypothetical protein n=1 Tax=Deinococcus sp. KNUC1210 TaxID=2917691 RepID=UPI00351CF2E9
MGVGRQSSGQAEEVTNCHCLMSVTLTRDEIPIPLRLKLFLASEWWTDEPRRHARVFLRNIRAWR